MELLIVDFVNRLHSSGQVVVLQVDTRVEGIEGVPDRLLGKEAITIQCGLYLPSPTEDFRANVDGVSVTLLFSMAPSLVFLPWASISAVALSNYGALVFFRKELQKLEGPRKMEAQQKGFRVIDGGRNNSAEEE